MTAQHGPRDVDSVLASRWWLTEKGWAATEAMRAQEGEDE